MAMKTDRIDSDETTTLLAKVLSPTSYGKSLYVRISAIGRDRRTDGGARDHGGTVEFVDDIHEYERGDYVHCTFEPSTYSDGHTLVRVESAVFSEPIDADEPTFPNTDIPKTCPSCGREASAIVKSKYDSMTGGKVSDTADSCTIDPDNRGSWFGFSGEMSYVH